MKKLLFILRVVFLLCVSRSHQGLLGADSGENTILFYGNGLVERLVECGELEAYLQLGRPNDSLKIRSMAWTGDEVGHRLRPEGYAEHMKATLSQWPAKTVVIGFGGNESFGGEAGLTQFKKDWEGYLREVRRLHPDAKLVLLAPMAVQSTPSVDGEARNREIAKYAKVVEEVAGKHGAHFVDLYEASLKAYQSGSERLTIQGVHLNERGAREMGRVVARSLMGFSKFDSGISKERLNEVALAAAQKSGYVAEIVRPKNGVVYFGVRKRPEEYEAEMPRYHQLVEQADAVIHDLVKHPQKRFSEYPRPSLGALPEGKSIPDRFSGGEMKAAKEQQKDLTVAEGYTLNLFASEGDFPELKNPVQIAFDARGRLWVVTMPSFPHTLPGEKPDDKILILEDTDRDGKADKCTVFAGGFDALDGVAFHEKGVLVSAQPRLFLMRDLNGDDRADTKEEVLRGVDVTDSHHGGMVATDPLGQVIFSDGVFHRSQFETPFGVVRGVDSTTYRLNLETGRIRSEWQSLTPNPWKVAFDRYGGIFERYGGGHVLDGLPLTWTPLGVYHAYGNGTVVNYAKGSGMSVISSPNFPKAYQQGVVSAALLGSYCVSISAPKIDSGVLEGTDRLDLITSQNSAFRPVDTAFGMDGALYVSDFASRIIGHAQHPMRDPQWNHSLGRIWRVVANDRPVSKDWPRIAGASVAELLKLLVHPQDLVREHARIELRGKGAELVPALDAWVASLPVEKEAEREQGLLEALLILAARGETREGWLMQLLQSTDPRMRAGAVQLTRHISWKLTDATALLKRAAQDAHPRVRMAVVNVVSHLRAEAALEMGSGVASAHEAHVQAGSRLNPEKALEGMAAHEPAVKQMVKDLEFGINPKRGRSVPVLEVNPSTEVTQWIAPAKQSTPAVKMDATKKGGGYSGTFRTYVESKGAQTVLLSVKHSFLDVNANGVQLLSADNNFSSQQQVQIELQKGVNVVEINFRRLKNEAARPPVFLFDLIGQPIEGATVPRDSEQLAGLASIWEKEHADELNALKVQAVPNLLQFSPKELRVKAGSAVRLIFENPDLMQHNFVLVAKGAEEEVGLLADQMATRPDGMTKNFIPETNKVLYATALINPNGKAELKFDAPKEAGSYPFLCTFPGHWRVMRGVLVVE